MLTTGGKKRLVVFIATSGAAIVIVLVSIALIRVTLSFNYGERLAEAIADKNQKDVEQEFREIKPLSLAVVIQHGSTHRTDQGIISADYKTEKSYEAIKLYYDLELKSRGWRLRREVGIKYDGKDNGGKEVIYCKGRYVASLQYAGRQETEFGWTFSFAMRWGTSDDCN